MHDLSNKQRASMARMRVLVISAVLASVLLDLMHRAEAKVPLLSREEDLELERQLKILNKPPLISFKDKDENIIDCINIYKQPAFDHPLLKDHKLQMWPSSIPKGVTFGVKDSIIHQHERKFKQCPPETVPFKRTKKEDLIRAREAFEAHKARPKWGASTPPPGVHFAGITTPNDGAHKFYGAQTVISVFNVAVVDNQTSAASMWLGSDVEGPFNGLEYGWTVNKRLYGDTATHTYSLWTSDGFKSTGCFNALCPGYVQVSKRRVMGQAERFVSTYAKTIYKRRILLHKDTKSGNWWLSEYIANGTNEPVGYWPRELFPSMSDYAAMAQFGGKVYSPPKVSPPAPMGSGHFVSNDFVRTCSASQIVFVDAFGTFYTPRDADIQVVADVPDVYYVEYLGDATRKHPKREFAVLFGGPDIIIKH